MLNFFKHYYTVLRYILKKKVTLNEKEKNVRHECFRGKIIFDESRCVKCKTCEKSCINKCIDVDDKFKIDYSSCCFCGRCTESCPTRAIYMDSSDVNNVTDKCNLIHHMKEEK